MIRRSEQPKKSDVPGGGLWMGSEQFDCRITIMKKSLNIRESAYLELIFRKLISVLD